MKVSKFKLSIIQISTDIDFKNNEELEKSCINFNNVHLSFLDSPKPKKQNLNKGNEGSTGSSNQISL